MLGTLLEAQVQKCICPNSQIHLSKLQNVFVQINFWNSCVLCGVGHSTGGGDASPASSASNRNIRFPKNSISSKTKTVFLPNSCLRYFPISYRAVNGRCTAGRMVIGNTPLDIWQILVIKSLYWILKWNRRYLLVLDIFLEPTENGSQKITSVKDGQNLCDKVILLGHLLLRFLSWRKFFSSDTFSFFFYPPTTFFLFSHFWWVCQRTTLRL